MTYRLELDSDASRTLRKLSRADPQAATRIGKAIGQLTDDPRPHGAKAITGSPDLLRIRVGDYRIVYTVEDDRLLVLVVRIGHRRDVYR